MNPINTQIEELADARARALYLAVVALFPVVIAGLLTLIVFLSGAVKPDDGIGHKTKFAQFSYPQPGNLVAGSFDVHGEIKQVPEGEVVYLVERVDGRFWPKLRLGSEPTTFSREQQTSAGSGFKYTIELLSLSAEGEKQIQKWFEDGATTGKYPGIASIDGAHVLAKVRVVHQ